MSEKWNCKKCGHEHKSGSKGGDIVMYIAGACGAGFVFGAGAFLVVIIIAVMQAITGSDGGADMSSKVCKKCGTYKGLI